MANDMVTRCARAISETGAASNWEQAVQAARAALEAMRYEDGTDEHLAIAAGAEIQVDPVLAIECFEAYLSAALSQEDRE